MVEFKNFKWCSCGHETENSLSHHEKFWERDEAKFPMPPSHYLWSISIQRHQLCLVSKKETRQSQVSTRHSEFSYRMLIFMDVEAIVVTPRDGKSRGEARVFTSASLRDFSCFAMARGSLTSRGAAIWNNNDRWLSKQLLLTVGIAPHVQI